MVAGMRDRSPERDGLARPVGIFSRARLLSSIFAQVRGVVFGGCAVPRGGTSEDGRAGAMSQISGSVCQSELSQLGAGRAAEPQLGGAPRGKE